MPELKLFRAPGGEVIVVNAKGDVIKWITPSGNRQEDEAKGEQFIDSLQ